VSPLLNSQYTEKTRDRKGKKEEPGKHIVIIRTLNSGNERRQ
jgi:hypothetical protein